MRERKTKRKKGGEVECGNKKKKKERKMKRRREFLIK